MCEETLLQPLHTPRDLNGARCSHLLGNRF